MAYFDCIVGGSGKGNTLVVTCADDLAGATITCTNGTKTYTKTCPSTAPYEVTFYGLMAGTWTVSATVSGNTYTTTVVVADIEALLGGFNWKTWVDTARFLDSTDYNSLDEVLADEEAVRELCLEHNCVDYLARIASTTADVETIIENDLFAKWVNNSDYSLNILGANTTIKALMDEADKYEYGEYCLMPQVPIMTANNAPYGEAFASSVYGSAMLAYHAFDGVDNNTSNMWASGNNDVVGAYIGYTFTSAVKITEFVIHQFTERYATSVKVQGSNDGFVSDVNDLSSAIDISASYADKKRYSFSNNVAYTSYRLYVLANSGAVGANDNVNIQYLQFYAYAPKGNVPVMTSNTAPYGSAGGSTANNSYPHYKAFDGDDTSYFETANEISSTGVAHIYYGAVNPICVRKFHIINGSSMGGALKIRYSDDATNWTECDEAFTLNANGSGTAITDGVIDDYGYHLYWDAYFTPTSSAKMRFRTLQFYGRELSVSVPTMTGNTTPYGEVISSGEGTANPAWKAFDNDNSSGWSSPSATTSPWYLGYEFTSNVCVKMVGILDYPSYKRIRTFKVQAKVNDSWEDISETLSLSGSETAVKYFSVNELNASGKASRILIQTTSGDNPLCAILQFYGLDYSEKEFEEGTTKKWLYDHGLELETFTTNTSGSGSVATKDADSLYNSVPASTNVSASALVNIDLTNYSLARMVVGKEAYGSVSNYASGGLVVLSTTTPTYNTSPDAQNYPLPPINDKNTIALDISSFNTTKAIGIFMRNVSSGSLKKFRADEIWLE